MTGAVAARDLTCSPPSPASRNPNPTPSHRDRQRPKGSRKARLNASPIHHSPWRNTRPSDHSRKSILHPARRAHTARMTQASAHTSWNSGLPALIQLLLEAGMFALIELVRNLKPLLAVIPGNGAKRRRPGTQPVERTHNFLTRIPREGGGPGGERSSPPCSSERVSASGYHRPRRVLTGFPPSRGMRTDRRAPAATRLPHA